MVDSDGNKENKKSRNKNKTSLGDTIFTLAVILMFFALFAIMIADDLRHNYDNQVNLSERAESEGMNYWSQANVVTQEVEVVYEPFSMYLSHESSTYEKVTKARSNYNDALKDGDPEKIVNAAMQFKMLAVNEAFPILGSEKLAEQTQIELKDSVSKMDGAFKNWSSAIREYNSARRSISGRISVLFWGYLLGGTDLPERIGYYKFEQKELNVSKTLERR